MGIGIQVTIRFLSLGNQIDDLISDGTKLLALSVGDAEGHRFQPFVQVCVLENGASVHTRPAATRKFSMQYAFSASGIRSLMASHWQGIT